MVHCSKHDVVHQEGSPCWCCEDAALPDKEAAYADPDHLTKRGGAGLAAAAAQAKILAVAKKLEALTPEQLAKLTA
jgi:hypothetical protein